MEYETRPLAGKIAIVTGGGTGIGEAIVMKLAGAGATVALCGRRREKVEAVAARVRAQGGGALALSVDVARSDQVRGLVHCTIAEYGGVDILVNNAGRHAQFRLAHEITDEDFDDFLGVDLRGPFFAIRDVVPHMLARGGGSIVNIASMTGLVGLKYCASYCAAKGGLVQLTKAVALDYADKNIRVNCICPGAITETGNMDHWDPAQEKLAKEVSKGGVSPMGRWGTVDEVATAVLYFVGPGSGFTTGAVLAVDGGYVVQ